MINAEVTKNGTESALSVIKRFTKKVQGSGVLNRVRSIRYSSRVLSPYKVQQRKLEVLRRRKAFEDLVKLGKIVPNQRGQKGKKK